MRALMSRRGNCYDNAPVESCWGTLNTELVHHRPYETREEAVREISEYIDSVLQSAPATARLGYMSPAAYRQLFMQQQAAA